MAKGLTTAAVLKYGAETKRLEIPDSTTGLHLIVQISGSKSWALRFRRPDGRPAKLTLGPVDLTGREAADGPVLGAPLTLGQARELANRINRERARGLDVIEFYKAENSRKRTAAAAEAANAFAGASRDYFIHHRTKWGERPRRWRDDARLLGLRWSPGDDPDSIEPEIIKGSLADVWASRPVKQIDAHDIITVVEDATRNGIPGLERANQGSSPARGRKMHAVLSGLFRWLQQGRRITANPCAGVWRPGPPPSRDRVLSDDEIRIFWRACEVLRAPYGQLFKFLLMTGCRRDEASKIEYAEIDETGLLTLPPSRTKNHIKHELPLPEMAIELLNSLPRIEGRSLVFCVARNRPPQDFTRAKTALDEEMKRLASLEGRAIKPWRIHDLRRTCASGLQSLNVRYEIVERVLNHIIPGVAGVYQRSLMTEEKAGALQRWVNHIQELLSEARAKRHR